MECQPVRCFCHFVSLAPEASRTQSKVCTQHEVSDTSEDPEKPSGLGSAASLVLTGVSGRGLSALGPPLPATYAPAVRAHLRFSPPSSKRSGSWHGYAERRDGDLSAVGFVRTPGPQVTWWGQIFAILPRTGRWRPGPDARDGVCGMTGEGLEARVPQIPGQSRHLGSRGRLKRGTRRDGSHGRAASG